VLVKNTNTGEESAEIFGLLLYNAVAASRMINWE
jgi:hypothetical protein